MAKMIFIPDNFEIDFNFTDGNCHKEKTGICPMDCFNKLNIKDLSQIRRNEYEFCPRMANKMLNGTLNPTFPVEIYFHKKCGHFSFQDGRHRTCITKHLHNLDIQYDLIVTIHQPNDKCVECKRKSKIKTISFV